MGFLKNIEKTFSDNHKILLVGLLVITLAIGMYTQRKGGSVQGMRTKNIMPRRRIREGMATNSAAMNKGAAPKQTGNVSLAQANKPMPPKEMPSKPANASAQASSVKSANTVIDPKQLLPADGGINNPNLLHAGHHAGINTVGTSLRNANLQLRSEPANPQVAVGPFLNSTIGPDTMRRPLEIGTN